MTLIDSHCHLDLPAFDTDRDEVIQDAFGVGVSNIIVPTIASAGWAKLQTLAAQTYALKIHAAYGLHPMFERQHVRQDLNLLETQISRSACVAVGECGLDFFVDGYNRERQLLFFTAQLDLAVQFQLPVIIHARKSLDIVLKELRLRPGLSGIVHSFSGSHQQAKQLIELGFYLGFGGPVTYSRAKKLRQLVSELPLESLVLETDAPDQPDAGYHGQRNVPARLPEIAKCIASLRGIDVSEVASITTGNCRRLFSL